MILAWLSDRTPDQWRAETLETRLDFGHFPHLVSREMIEAIRGACHAYVEGQRDRWIGLDTTSRLTGRPAPFFIEDGADFAQRWRNDYYASRESVEDIVERMAAVIPAA